MSECDQIFGQEILQLWSLTTRVPLQRTLPLGVYLKGNTPWQKISVWNGANEEQSFCISYCYCISFFFFLFLVGRILWRKPVIDSTHSDFGLIFQQMCDQLSLLDIFW